MGAEQGEIGLRMVEEYIIPLGGVMTILTLGPECPLMHVVLQVAADASGVEPGQSCIPMALVAGKNGVLTGQGEGRLR